MANGQGPRRAPNAGGALVRRTPMQRLVYWTMVAGVWGAIFMIAFFAVFAWGMPDTSKLDQVTKQPEILFLDRSGTQLASRGSKYAPPIDLDDLPKYVPDAFIAIEDRRFYWHPGFDPGGIARAAMHNIFSRKEGENLSGGSTITQQLARNLFLSFDQTWRRKCQELILAVWLEAKFSKKHILELYLNRVYFGAGANGIEAAATRYFNKSAKNLTLGEAALLAGLMKAPSRYSPIAGKERAGDRATLVLDAMVKTKKITPAQRDAAIREGVTVSRTLRDQHAQYFVDWVDQEVRRLYGEPTEDLIVETTLDLQIQMAAENAVKMIVDRDSKTRGVEQAALVALDGEGRVRAYVGGASYADSPFDRASNAKRQAGSAFKPFVYLTAMDQGHRPDEAVVDEPVTIGNWTPRNYTGRYLGPINLQTALAQSVNTVAARLASEVGTSNVASTARRLGIRERIQTDPSMALGAVEVTPVQMAQAYAPFANGGVSAPAYSIERIRSADGRIVFDRNIENRGRSSVIRSPSLQYMNQMMRTVVSSGTGTGARVPGYDLAGKTGTTSDYRDAWFIGYTGGFVAAVWVGKDNNKPMKGVTGGNDPAEIWRLFMGPTLPRLAVQAIPGGDPPPASPIDAIGDLISGDFFKGDAQQTLDGAQAPPIAPTPSPAPSPPAPAAAPAPAAPPPF